MSPSLRIFFALLLMTLPFAMFSKPASAALPPRDQGGGVGAVGGYESIPAPIHGQGHRPNTFKRQNP